MADDTQVTTVRLPTWMYEVARSAARVEGVSMNAWLNRAISVYIERKKQDPEWRAKALAYNDRLARIIEDSAPPLPEEREQP